MSDDKITASVVKRGLLPPIKPIWEAHIRDAVVIVGGDGAYYMTGSTGDNIWAYNDGVEVWRSADLKDWKYLGVVWNIEKDGTWKSSGVTCMANRHVQYGLRSYITSKKIITSA